ncbi:MAG: hypothetical protein OEV95_06625 [Gemmatimonadota bacterium]|nr:hypothetical protein [Gemmatimonadota bacterium]MDH5283525.1 hypothetical protein [Gemmatimonadota bacterium]
MKFRTLFTVLAAGVTVASCTSEPLADPASQLQAARSGPAFAASAEPEEEPVLSPFLADLDARLAASGSNLRVLRAEFMVDTGAAEFGSQVLIANNRVRGLAYEWVSGDPRRGGRVGVNYAFDPYQGREPFTRNPDGSGLRQMPFAELEPQLEQAMSAWRDRTCSDAPIDRVALPAGVDPDLLDNLFLGSDGGRGTPVTLSDIVQAGWQLPSFFTAFAGPSGNNIIGVTFSFYFVDGSGNPTDINGDGRLDTGLAELYYNTRFAWGNSGAPNVVDTWHITTHETGHAVSLAHFGKVFVTKRDAANGISITDIKYAPRALMNAVYVTGRTPITGTDNSSFCQVWASKN